MCRMKSNIQCLLLIKWELTWFSLLFLTPCGLISTWRTNSQPSANQNMNIYPWLFGKWLLEIDGGHREFSSPNHIGLETSQWASENHSSLGKNMLAEAQRDNFCFEGKCSVFQVCIALFLPLGEILASLLGYLQTSLHLLRTLRATTGIY